MDLFGAMEIEEVELLMKFLLKVVWVKFILGRCY